MIRLKDGQSVDYNEDFDVFFRRIVAAVLKSSLTAASGSLQRGEGGRDFNERLLREIMDNCIYITHQVRELTKKDERMFDIFMTGCLFNCMVFSLSKFGSLTEGKDEGGGEDDTVH